MFFMNFHCHIHPFWRHLSVISCNPNCLWFINRNPFKSVLIVKFHDKDQSEQWYLLNLSPLIVVSHLCQGTAVALLAGSRTLSLVDKPCCRQGGRSCTGARVGPAEKFGLGRKFLAWTYAILSQIKICRDLRTFWRSLGKKSAFLGQKQYFLGKKCTITWYILHILLS